MAPFKPNRVRAGRNKSRTAVILVNASGGKIDEIPNEEETGQKRFRERPPIGAYKRSLIEAFSTRQAP